MRSRILILLAASGVACAALTAGSGPVDARPKFSTRYTYYPVQASSAQGLFQQMVLRGPHVAGRKAFAATTALTRHSGAIVRNKTCSVRGYKIQVDFTIQLPKLRSGTNLNRGVARRWRNFAAFVRRHEERHRAIWMGCAREIERRIRRIRTKSCNTVNSRTAAIIESVGKACNRRHDAFDAAERNRLRRHPLIRAASRVKKNSTRVATLRASKLARRQTPRRVGSARRTGAER